MPSDGPPDPSGNKAYESVASVRGYLVDTSARILFYVPAIGVWEKLVAGMENTEVFRSRAGAIAMNFVAGRALGVIREWLSRITRTHEGSSPVRKLALDTAAATVVGVTSYSIVLACAGVSLDEALIALPFGLLFTSCTGRPYGRFLDWYRRVWGTTPVLD